MANLQFDTLNEANEAISKINRIAIAYAKLCGKSVNGTIILEPNGGQTVTWDTPQLVDGKYEINYPTEDTRYNKCNLHLYNLGLPINASGIKSGEHDMISVSPLGYSSEWFSVATDGSMTFTCPDYGAYSPNSTYPRTELRHLTDYQYSQSSEHTIYFSVEQGVSGTGVIVHQAHGSSETLYIAKLFMDVDGQHYLKVYVDKKEDNSNTISITLKENISYGQKIKLRAVYNVTEFLLYIDDALALTVTDIAERVTNTYYYWKAGAYWDKNDNNGDVCIVKHYPI